MDKWNGSSGTFLQLQNIVFMYLHNEQTNTWFGNIEEDIYLVHLIYTYCTANVRRLANMKTEFEILHI